MGAPSGQGATSEIGVGSNGSESGAVAGVVDNVVAGSGMVGSSSVLPSSVSQADAVSATSATTVASATRDAGREEMCPTRARTLRMGGA
jgi:hypothetical protein